MIEYIFLRILFMSIALTMGGAVIFAAEKLFSKIFTKKVIYYLWLSVIGLSIVPVMGMTYHSRSANEIPYIQSDYSTLQQDAIQMQTNTQTTMQAVNKDQAPVVSERSSDAVFPAQTKTDRSISYTKTLAFIYFMALAVLAVIHMFKAIKFRLKLKRMTVPYDSELLEYCKELAGMKKDMEIFSVKADCSPFVYGIFKSKIVVPDEHITCEVIVHELTHIKHRDLHWLFLLNIAKILHFFNPFIYLYTKQTKTYMEFACDESVSAVLNNEQRLQYSKSIIEYAAPRSFGAVCLSENGKNIKERIDIIMTNKKSRKFAKITSTILVLAILACQAIIASAINDKSPAKSYMINNAREIYSVMYHSGDQHFYSGKSGRTENRASLVNTEFYKGFSADLKLKFKSASYLEEDADIEKNTTKADMRIVMDSFIEAVDQGKVWQGLFTVTINDEVILSKAKGYLNDIPGSGNRNFARLYIESENGDVSFDVEHIDFGLSSDSVINTEYEEEKLNAFASTNERYLSGSAKMIYTNNDKTVQEETDYLYLALLSNKENGRFLCEEIPFTADRYITTVPGEKYTFKNNSVTGKFFLKKSGSIILDEFEGTLSNINTDNIELKSSDNSITVTMSVKDNDETEDFFTGSLSYLGDSEFEKTCTKKNYARRLSDLPFTLTLSEDRTKAVLKIKDGFEPDGWYFSYSSYIGENDVYSKDHSKYGRREVELEISPSYGTHNLQFSYYNANPYVHKSYYDLLFRIVNGEILYYNCAEYITENTQYSDIEGINMINEYLVNLDFPETEER